MRKHRFIRNLGLIYLLAFISLELIFRSLNGFDLWDLRLMTVLLFGLSNTLMIYAFACLFSIKVQKLVLIISLGLMTFLGLTQMIFRSYMNANYSLSFFFSMADRVEDYAFDFISYIHLKHLLILIPATLFTLLVKHLMINQNHQHRMLRMGLMVMFSIFTHQFALDALSYLKLNASVDHLIELHENPYIPELSFAYFGLSETIKQDVLSLMNERDQKSVEIPVVNFMPIITNEPKEKDENIEIDLRRVFDDSDWIKRMNEEEDPILKSIDAYLMNRPITDKNAYTGLFKDKNLIYIMVEAFDFMAIDEKLTPTLFRLSQEGLYFDHFYSPQYSCATGESEFIGLTSLIPRSGICTPNTYQENAYRTSLFNLFNQAGYFSSSYHNYSDKFYDRTLIHESLGSTKFYNNDDLDIKVLKGWPSDVNLMEEAFKVFGDQEKFFSFIITSSTHFPYDVDSTLGNRYLEKVQSIYPDMPLNIQRYKSKAMELDHSIQRLIDLLSEKGILEDTVLILYGDHFPLKTAREDILHYGDPNGDRSIGFNINTLPMIIYNVEVEGKRISDQGSTFDLVPTIANLFDLDFDPRLYFGLDLFDDAHEKIVMYPSLSWNHSLGYYSSSSGQFKPYDPNSTLTDEDIEIINQRVKNDSDVSYHILKKDYFKAQ